MGPCSNATRRAHSWKTRKGLGVRGHGDMREEWGEGQISPFLASSSALGMFQGLPLGMKGGSQDFWSDLE